MACLESKKIRYSHIYLLLACGMLFFKKQHVLEGNFHHDLEF